MKNKDQVEEKIKTIKELIQKREMDVEHADPALRYELYSEIESLQNEVDLLNWVLSES